MPTGNVGPLVTRIESMLSFPGLRPSERERDETVRETPPLRFFYSFQEIELSHLFLKRHLRHLERCIIPSKKERGKEIIIKFRNIIFNLGWNVSRSILINILIKNTTLEWFVIIIFIYSLFYPAPSK
jgi:hypothetical protein